MPAVESRNFVHVILMLSGNRTEKFRREASLVHRKQMFGCRYSFLPYSQKFKFAIRNGSDLTDRSIKKSAAEQKNNISALRLQSLILEHVLSPVVLYYYFNNFIPVTLMPAKLWKSITAFAHVLLSRRPPFDGFLADAGKYPN